MGDTEDLLAWLRQKHQEMPKPEAGSFYSIAADELMRLEGRLAEADTNADLAYADATRAEDEVTYWKARARRAADADEILALPVPWVDCPTCNGSGRIGCPGPSGGGARTQRERDALGLRKGIDYCYGMHMGHSCPACTGTGHATVAQLLAWGSAVAEPIESPRFPGDDKYDDVADYRNRILDTLP